MLRFTPTFLAKLNPASNDISVMAIRQDGSLQLVGTPFQSRGIAPASLALSRDFLFVANKGDAATPPNYAGFRVASDGSLSPVRRLRDLNIGDNPIQVLFNVLCAIAPGAWRDEEEGCKSAVIILKQE
jgi:hypothetical protein